MSAHGNEAEPLLPLESQITRGQLFRLTAVGGLTLFASPLASAASAATKLGLEANNDTGGVTGAEIRKVLGLGEKGLGGGTTFQLGAVLALTGSGSFYGDVMSKGINLATAQITAAGGPTISVVYKDNKSGNAQAGTIAARELGIAGVHACLSSYVGDIGSMFPGIKQYKMLTLDGGGGTSDFGQGKPYFWGMRALEPDDDFIGALLYFKKTMPKVKRVQMIYIDQGPINSIVVGNFKKALAKTRLEFAGAEAYAIGSTDFSTALSHIKANNPDAIFGFLIGVDMGYFMKQLVNSGMGNMPIINSEYVPDAAKIAGSAFKNFMWAEDYFDAKHPRNPWSKLLVKSFRNRYHQDPELFAANYYEDTFAIWDLIRRVLAKGQDPNNGTNLQNALLAHPSFESVYGGTADTVGLLTLDKKLHKPTSRPLGVFSYNGGHIKQLASFGLGGKDFKILG